MIRQPVKERKSGISFQKQKPIIPVKTMYKYPKGAIWLAFAN